MENDNDNDNDNEAYIYINENSDSSISESSLDESDLSFEENETDDEKNRNQQHYDHESLWEIYDEKNDKINYIGNNEADIEIEQPSIEVEASPFSYFKLFITDNLIEYIIEKSDLYQKYTLNKLKTENKVKKNSRINKWKKPSIDEFHKYLGILLWMSIHGNNDYTGNILHNIL